MAEPDVVERLLEWEELQILIDGAEPTGTVRMLQLLELVEPFELEPPELEALRDELEARGVDVVEEAEPEEAPAPPRRSSPSPSRRPTRCSSSFARPVVMRC